MEETVCDVLCDKPECTYLSCAAALPFQPLKTNIRIQPYASATLRHIDQGDMMDQGTPADGVDQARTTACKHQKSTNFEAEAALTNIQYLVATSLEKHASPAQFHAQSLALILSWCMGTHAHR